MMPARKPNISRRGGGPEFTMNLQPVLRNPGCRLLPLGISVFVVGLCWSANVSCQEKPAAPSPTTPTYRLADCLAIARQQAPAILAARASLAAAMTGHQSLQQLRGGALLAKDLPIRKQQAAWGVNAAAANLAQVECDTDCAVARTYYSVTYARDQRQIADQIVIRLKLTVANGETLLGKEGAPPDLNPLAIEKAKLYLSMSETRLHETIRGQQRAKAALREAMGLDPEVDFQVAEDKLPEATTGIEKSSIMDLALARRGEISQSQSAVNITCLEVHAQSKSTFVKRPTAASGGDMHARPIPTGSFGDNYVPGAIGLDFPSMFVGSRTNRMQRASELSSRAQAAADKARNLVALDAEDAWLRWEEATSNITKLKPAVKNGAATAQKAQDALDSGVIQSYRDVLEMFVLVAQTQAKLNEAYYQHMIALTELERVTAGGYPAGITVMPVQKP
jgi:outer membrane protein TolC